MSRNETGAGMFDRRKFAQLAAASTLLLACRPSPGSAAPGSWSARIAALEADRNVRLGACVLDLATGATVGWRQDERFALCSSFKLSLAALVLREADAGRLDLAERIDYLEADLMPVSPVTRANLGKGMTLAALAEATQVTSDNAAANLLLAKIGGPPALTRFWRSLGDRQSRLDRNEPALNSVFPGDPRDTTTPAAMARSLHALLGPRVLSSASRARLEGWMAATQTGTRRIRAGLRAGWVAGDKTGTGLFENQPSHYIDLALATAPSGRRIVITGFVATTVPQRSVDPALEALLARLGSIAAEWAEATPRQA